MNGKTIVRVITGPTGSGKSRMALRLAEEMGFDIICMDSMQIYRRMDIGTAKPTLEEQGRVRHHMLDILEPAESFTVSEYRDMAEDTVRKLAEEGREALFVGGTGLYLQSMVHPMAMGAVPADENLRNELRALAAEPEGRERLHEMLRELDPATAERLPLNDIRRIIRAIEVTRATGVPFSEQPDREIPSPFEWRIVSTALPREELYRRINLRVDEMIKAGLADEVEGLLKEGVPENAQSMAGLGYKEMIPYIKGFCTLEEAAYAIKLGTRHYAKRQITFLKRESAVRYADVSSESVYDEIRNVLVNPR